MSDVRSTADSDCCSLKFVTGRPFADPEVAARKIVELANAFEPLQDVGGHVQHDGWYRDLGITTDLR